MSASKRVRLHCDVTACSESVDTSERSVAAARITAEAWGWGRRGRDDVCPWHVRQAARSKAIPLDPAG